MRQQKDPSPAVQPQPPAAAPVAGGGRGACCRSLLVLFLGTVLLQPGLSQSFTNFSGALADSLLFYQAQRSGPLPPQTIQLIPWKRSAFMNDRAPNGQLVTGGYFDAGDYVRFNFPQAWTIATLAWGALEFPEGYTAAGQLSAVRDAIRWGADYFLRSILSPTEFVAQVGNADQDHAQWTNASVITTPYPAYTISPSNPGADLAGAVTAALAATSLVFRGVDDAYAQRTLDAAITWYRFGTTYDAFYSNSVPQARAFYPSTSRFDDLSWGAAWLYRATGNVTYLQQAESYWQRHITEEGQSWPNYEWNNVEPGAALLLYRATNGTQYLNYLTNFMNSWTRATNGVVYLTSGLPGIAVLDDWGTLRYNSNAQFIMLILSQLLPNQQLLLTCFARNQMERILGSTGRSFVVGFGTSPPCRPHHRYSSCPNPPIECSWATAFYQSGCNFQTLTGALVGGPNSQGEYSDSRPNFQQNEVAIDYNAGFTGALAGLIQAPVTRQQCIAQGLFTFPVRT